MGSASGLLEEEVEKQVGLIAISQVTMFDACHIENRTKKYVRYQCIHTGSQHLLFGMFGMQ